MNRTKINKIRKIPSIAICDMGNSFKKTSILFTLFLKIDLKQKYETTKKASNMLNPTRVSLLL